MSAALGLLAASVFLVAFPPSHKAEAVLVLAHDPQVDPERAISTDVSLLTTRAVAAQTITNLGLIMTADDFLSTVTAVPESSDVMSSGCLDVRLSRFSRCPTSAAVECRG
jgi:hypothetical protein